MGILYKTTRLVGCEAKSELARYDQVLRKNERDCLIAKKVELLHMADDAVGAAREYLLQGDAESAISLLETVPAVFLENAHYLFKRSYVLMCAFHKLGQQEAAERERAFMVCIQHPAFAWDKDFEGWWGDTIEMSEMFQMWRSIH